MAGSESKTTKPASDPGLTSPPPAIRGEGEVFICKVGSGNQSRHARHLRQAEEVITPQGMRTSRRGVIIVFESGRYVCKAEQDMSAADVAAAIRALPEYDIEIFSLSDDKTMRTGPIATGMGLKCQHCDKSYFAYLEEYNAHVAICQRVKTDAHLKRHYEAMRTRAAQAAYVPNESPRSLKNPV